MAKAKTDNDAAIVKWTEIGKNFRLSVCLVFAGFCVWQIQVGHKNYLTAQPDTEPWERVTSQVIGYLATALIPSGLFAFGFRYVRRWTRQHMDREAKLEKIVDPGRTTSGIQPDGTEAPGTTP